jgi:hypothetical protein
VRQANGRGYRLSTDLFFARLLNPSAFAVDKELFSRGMLFCKNMLSYQNVRLVFLHEQSIAINCGFIFCQLTIVIRFRPLPLEA